MVGLSDLVPELLMDNRIVELGVLGTLSLHLQTDGVTSPDEVSYRKIKLLKIQYRPGVCLKKAIGHVSYNKSKKSKY